VDIALMDRDEASTEKVCDVAETAYLAIEGVAETATSSFAVQLVKFRGPQM
jgi:hypothetical protein